MKKTYILLSIITVIAVVIVTLSFFQTYTITGINNDFLGEYSITLLPSKKFTANIDKYATKGSYSVVKSIDETLTYYFYDTDGKLSFTARQLRNSFRIDNMNFIKTSLF